jgi:hypothetical protein
LKRTREGNSISRRASSCSTSHHQQRYLRNAKARTSSSKHQQSSSYLGRAFYINQPTFKMQFTTTSSAAFLATILSTTNAAPAPQTTVTPGATIPWQVSNFELGCSPAACAYRFNISGPATADVGPAFATYCSGSDVQDEQVACADPGVKANLVSLGVPEGLVLYVNRYGPVGDEGVASGNATAAPAGEPAYSSFVIPAKFYGVIAN